MGRQVGFEPHNETHEELFLYFSFFFNEFSSTMFNDVIEIFLDIFL